MTKFERLRRWFRPLFRNRSTSYVELRMRWRALPDPRPSKSPGPTSIGTIRGSTPLETAISEVSWCQLVSTQNYPENPCVGLTHTTLLFCVCLGLVHSVVAPFFTLLLDMTAYQGENLRKLGAMEVKKRREKASLPSPTRVLDLGCGTGTSTRELKSTFVDAEVREVGQHLDK